MTDNLTPEDRRKTMRAVKGSGTKLERCLWAMLAGGGVKGWSKNVTGLRGKPDVVFVSQQVAVFVDGCFWHGCPCCNRKLPETNKEYWAEKVRRNAERDARNTRYLMEQGWQVLRIWEHDLRDAHRRRQFREEIQAAMRRRAVT